MLNLRYIWFIDRYRYKFGNVQLMDEHFYVEVIERGCKKESSSGSFFRELQYFSIAKKE